MVRGLVLKITIFSITLATNSDFFLLFGCQSAFVYCDPHCTVQFRNGRTGVGHVNIQWNMALVYYG